MHTIFDPFTPPSHITLQVPKAFHNYGRGGKIDNLNATVGWIEPIELPYFKAMIRGSGSECQDIGRLQSISEYPNALTLENVSTDLGQCFVTA